MGKIKEAWPFLLPVPDVRGGGVRADIPNVFYSLDLKPTRRFTFVSDNVRTRFGYGSRELIADADLWIKNVHPEGAESDAYPFWMRTDPCGSDHQVVEYRLQRKNGECEWVHDESRVVRNRTGAAVKIVGSWINISKRKAAEIALRDSELQLRQALDERERLSRDLHDGIVQSIYAIGLGLEESLRVMSDDHHAAKEGVVRAIHGLNEVIREVRQHIVWNHTQVLSPQQLRADLRALSKTVKGANRLRFRLELDARAAARLSIDASRNVLNIVREAMSNSLRHSKGRSGLVSLRTRDGGVRLVISDDGVGFDVTRGSGQGLGLKNMVVRANELGASLDIDSRNGRGTVITIDLPGYDGQAPH